MNTKETIPSKWNAHNAKEFFSSSLESIFSDEICVQSRYSADDIVRVIRNAITMNEYVETYVKNNPSIRTPSADTIFRRIHGIASEPGSHRRKGSVPMKSSMDQSGIDLITDLIDRIVKTGIALGAFKEPVNVAIDEHDEPYYGMDNRYLINAPFHKFRGTSRAYRFATLESIKRGERFTLSVMRKHPLDGIDNASEVDLLIRHAISLGVVINMVLMDRGYLDVGVMKRVESHNLKYIIPAKDNKKVIRFRKMEMKYSDEGFSFLVIKDNISSGKETVDTDFVHVVYYAGGKRHDFSFYTNAHVDEHNVINIAETYRSRWGIENGYQEKSDTEEKTHSPEMGL
ncbi:transposase (ISH3), partial [mine drainage metagenome]